MNEARKALINIQKASPGLPVGRFHPQLAIIADFFDTLVNIQIERDKLHRQLAEAHECFGTLLAEMATPPASVPDQAKQAAIGFTGTRPTMVIMGEYFDDAKAGKITASAVAALKYFDIGSIKNFDITEFNRDDQVPSLANINAYYGKTGAPTAVIPDAYIIPDGHMMSEVSQRFGPLTYDHCRKVGYSDDQLKHLGLMIPVTPNA